MVSHSGSASKFCRRAETQRLCHGEPAAASSPPAVAIAELELKFSKPKGSKSVVSAHSGASQLAELLFPPRPKPEQKAAYGWHERSAGGAQALSKHGARLLDVCHLRAVLEVKRA